MAWYNTTMAKRRCNVDTKWTPEFAYVVGLIATDGNLSNDGRHISITSKDYEIPDMMRKVLKLSNSIGKKARGGSRDKKYFRLQFGDINFYEFLLSMGLTPKKSKTLREMAIPHAFFADFLRGCIDGDGSIDSFMHPESTLPQLRVRLVSASSHFLKWIHNTTRSLFGVRGGSLYILPRKSVHVLHFAKADSRIILQKLYYTRTVSALSRKRVVAEALLKGE